MVVLTCLYLIIRVVEHILLCLAFTLSYSVREHCCPSFTCSGSVFATSLTEETVSSLLYTLASFAIDQVTAGFCACFWDFCPVHVSVSFFCQFRTFF